MAPPGHGPVISSLDGIGTPAPGQSLKIEPISWCTQGACALVLAPAIETAELVAIEATAAASASFVVVLGAAIGIGLVLGVLLAILFPGEIGIAGLLEYPIDFDTNFDTFDNWAADEGEWFNSLKMYAEVIKTTNLLAGQYHIPFAWNDADDGRLRRTIDAACVAQTGSQSFVAGCGDGFAVYVPGGRNYQFRPMQETGAHIVAALGNGSFPQPPARLQWFCPARSINGQAARNAGFSRGWFDQLPFRPNDCTGRPPIRPVCDEFPFWVTNQAVTLSGIRADLKPVPQAEALPQASDLSGFGIQCDVDDNERYVILPVPQWVAANGPSFGFRVNPGGASLCLSPRP